MTLRAFLFFIITTLIALPSSHAQRQNNWWYFNNAAVDFNSGSPVSVAGSAMTTTEGSASVADRLTGDLLFYTNGISIWNKNNQVMPNGNGLRGGTQLQTSSTNAALIVPRPGNPTQYYVFTADEQGNSNTLHYNLVDMTLNGGLGDVVSGQKNILLNSSSSEKLAYAPHADGVSFWLLAHEIFGDGWLAYRVDASGVNPTPVTSNAGVSLSNGAGCLKFSPNFKKIANVFVIGSVDVLDFNNQTGVVSNGQTFPVPIGSSVYGVEFSPSGRYLYVSNIIEAIYQLDLANPSAPRQTVALTGAVGLQLGPDCKIYVANGGLGVINQPDSSAANCNFQSTALNLANGTGSSYGLPMQVFFLDQVAPPKIAFRDSCAGNTTQFRFTGNGVYSNLRWHFGDPASGSNNSLVSPQPANVSHVYALPGKYRVQVIFNNECKTDTLVDTVTIINCNSVAPGPCTGSISARDTCVENGTRFSIISDSTIVGVQWTFGDPGSGIRDTSTLANPTHFFSRTGRFTITAIVDFTCGKDTLETTLDLINCAPDTTKCQILVPDVFTPNEDGLNDAFRLLKENCSFRNFRIHLYNRWGQEVYQSNDPDFTWKGEKEQQGSFIYLIEAETIQGERLRQKGNVLILR